MDATETIYKAAAYHFGNYEHHMRNKFIFHESGECDFYCVSKTGYCNEIEVKVSRSDFKADFAKPKHNIYKAVHSKQKYYLKRMEDSGHYEHRTMCGAERYVFVKESSGIEIIETANIKIPNRFWFFVPDGLVDKSDVPDYAGLAYVGEHFGAVKIIKEAPYMHKTKYKQSDLLFQKYVYITQSLQREVIELQRKLSKTGG